jgi:hypothetical protein
MFHPRDIIQHHDDSTLYIVEQVVTDKKGTQLLVKDMDSDSHWVFGAHTCRRLASPSNKG